MRGLSEEELDHRGGGEGWSIRENVHHLVEANLIASNMIIAALATDGYEFDWTWVQTGRKWAQRLGYDKISIEPAIALLRALGRHIAALVSAQPGALARKVRLNDKPGAPRYTMTVEKILEQEIEHVRGHLGDIQSIRSTLRRKV